MNKQLADFIRELSLKDTKNLSQKALKSAEEVGELAKKVLPFEDAHACRHRFVDKKAILEEVADVILTVKSIAYSLDYDDDELEEMIKDKAVYWAELQNRDAKAKFPVPYEIHVTVKNDESLGQIDFFNDVCQLLKVKPILLDLQKDGKTVLNDLMISAVHVGNNTSAYNEMKRISAGLSDYYEVVREKIETVPWHPAVPSIHYSRHGPLPPGCYFEAHLAVITDEKRLPWLQTLANECGAHLSRNVFKKIDDKHFKIMATYRRYDGYKEDFEQQAEAIQTKFRFDGFAVDRFNIEFSIYDSKISHDAAWLKK